MGEEEAFPCRCQLFPVHKMGLSEFEQKKNGQNYEEDIHCGKRQVGIAYIDLFDQIGPRLSHRTCPPVST